MPGWSSRVKLRAARHLPILLLCCWISGCAAISRLAAVPEEQTSEASVYGIQNARYILDKSRPAELIAEYQRARERELVAGRQKASSAANYLAISGGSDNGAFGAGLLVGWTERGDRPTFDAVTGVSTGALTAPFA